VAAKTYVSYNGAMPTTAALVPVTTGTAIKTMLQIATPSTEQLRVIEWGISFDGSAAATPGRVELIETDVAATVTAHVGAGVMRHNAPNDVASLVTLGTAATGYTASAEGTTTAARLLDYQLVAPSAQYVKQFPLGREPEVAASKFLRVRVTFAAAVNAVCYVIWEE
jgi:hypothetical protein